MFGTFQGISACRLCLPILKIFSQQPVRTGVIFRRMYPPRLYKQSQTGPFRPKLRRREFVYILEDDTNWKPAGDMNVILTTDIEGLGFEGDIVSVSKRLARNHMIPVGVADYATDGNLLKYESVRKSREHERRQTLTACKTMKQLENMTLPIPMSSSLPWTLNTTHVKVAFRMQGVNMNEAAIELPDEPVTQPQQLIIHVTVNGVSRVPVKVLIYSYNKSVVPSLPPVWSQSTESQFNIYQVISQAAHRLHGLEYDETDQSFANQMANRGA